MQSIPFCSVVPPLSHRFGAGYADRRKVLHVSPRNGGVHETIVPCAKLRVGDDADRPARYRPPTVTSRPSPIGAVARLAAPVRVLAVATDSLMARARCTEEQAAVPDRCRTRTSSTRLRRP